MLIPRCEKHHKVLQCDRLCSHSTFNIHCRNDWIDFALKRLSHFREGTEYRAYGSDFIIQFTATAVYESYK